MIFSILFTALFTVTSPAVEFECDTQQILMGNWAINRFFTMADGCLVQVTPIQKPNLTYREYVFDQMGRFTIFNSTPGDYETATSMRTYFFFSKDPKEKSVTPKVKQRNENFAEVTLISGETITFRGDNSFIESIEGNGFQFKEEKWIHLNKGGGFEVLSNDELFIDAGWKIGGRSYRDRSATSTVLWKGTSCPIPNENLFVYVDSTTGEELYQPALRWNLEQMQSWFLETCTGSFHLPWKK